MEKTERLVDKILVLLSIAILLTMVCTIVFAGELKVIKVKSEYSTACNVEVVTHVGFILNKGDTYITYEDQNGKIYMIPWNRILVIQDADVENVN